MSAHHDSLVTRAFELAQSGAVQSVEDLEIQLRAAGYLTGDARMTVAMRRAVASTISLAHETALARQRAQSGRAA